mgnify:CR=1 FL=1
MPSKDNVIIFDTTLRDGEQSPGFSMTIDEKLTLARQLARLKVDVIEAGFPQASPGDFEAVSKIAKTVKGPTIAGLARAIAGDIDRCAEAVKPAKKKRIHTFVGTSPEHMKYQMKKTSSQVLRMAVTAVKRARGYVKDVEFSAMDASRTDLKFLYEILEAAIAEGATTVNIPDTVGYAIPAEFGEMIASIKENVPNIGKAIISVHCHDDLGMAVSNSIEAVRCGARQIECAVNGIGERAGNASLEEVVMAIRTRKDYMKVGTLINTKEIYKTSQLLISITGVPVQPNKAIVGENAFAHESGIHQDGVLKKRTTFEIMTTASIGAKKSKLVLGKHSGRHAFSKRLKELGYKLKQEALDKAFGKFKILADKKKEIFDEDLQSIVGEEISTASGEKVFELVHLQTSSGTNTVPTATVSLKKGDKVTTDSSIGDGPVDATYRAIERITGIKGKLMSYNIRSVTLGKDAMGEVTLRARIGNEMYVGKGSSTDVIEASAKAWLTAINRKAGER